MPFQSSVWKNLQGFLARDEAGSKVRAVCEGTKCDTVPWVLLLCCYAVAIYVEEDADFGLQE
jgi:hypothetical protein